MGHKRLHPDLQEVAVADAYGACLASVQSPGFQHPCHGQIVALASIPHLSASSHAEKAPQLLSAGQLTCQGPARQGSVDMGQAPVTKQGCP